MSSSSAQMSLLAPAELHQTDRQTVIQTDRQIDRYRQTSDRHRSDRHQTDRHTDRQTDRQTGIHTDRHRQTYRQDRHTYRQIDRQTYKTDRQQLLLLMKHSTCVKITHIVVFDYND